VERAGETAGAGGVAAPGEGEGDGDGGPRRVAIVGAGISGLAAAHRLLERDPAVEVTVLDGAPRAGGVLQTRYRDGFLLEASADSFLTALPRGVALCRRAGLEAELLPTDPAHRRAFVVRRGRLVPLPEGLMLMAPRRIWPMVTTPLLSPLGKLRMAADLVIPRGPGGDESLRAFAVRRFGREAFDRLIQPLVSGMYTGDPDRLSVRATMPRFVEMERQDRSLIRAARKAAAGGEAAGGSGARYGMFASLRGGMGTLPAALADALPADSLRLGTAVRGLARVAGGRWALWLGDGSTLHADAVVVATPAAAASRLLRVVDGALADDLGAIPATGCAVASLGYRRDQVAHALDGFGFVVPHVEGRPILSGSFSSVKFPGRAPEGHALFRVFLGGARRQDVLDGDDDTLLHLAHAELAALLGVRGAPVLSHLDRWPGAMPQYHVGHLDRVAAIRRRLGSHPGLALAGNSYEGVGVPYCIGSGESAADAVLAALPARA
jgi:oxygen-dependent protoporphyrinogen oxidase